MLGLVGESGSGKTTAGLALLGHTRRGVRDRRRQRAGRRHGRAGARHAQPGARLRGGVVSYVPQDPAAALNPALRIGTQLRETLEAHGFGASDDERTRAASPR